jgi:hypothetical protein
MSCMSTYSLVRPILAKFAPLWSAPHKFGKIRQVLLSEAPYANIVQKPPRMSYRHLTRSIMAKYDHLWQWLLTLNNFVEMVRFII